MEEALKTLEQEKTTLAHLLQQVNALTGLTVALPSESSSNKVG
jgi:hypothetical protein